MFNLVAAIAAVILTAGMATPAAAAGRPPYDATVACYYRTTAEDDSGWTIRLRRIEVQPPVLYPIRQQQVVGWRFVVQRQFDFESWVPIYRSPVQKAVASWNEAAVLTAMGVRLDIPELKRGDRGLYYRVVLKMFWYNANGSRQRVVSYRFGEYDEYRDGEFAWNGSSSCPFAWTSG